MVLVALTFCPLSIQCRTPRRTARRGEHNRTMVLVQARQGEILNSSRNAWNLIYSPGRSVGGYLHGTRIGANAILAKPVPH